MGDRRLEVLSQYKFLSKLKNKKGYFFTLDVFIAVTILLVGLLIIFSFTPSKPAQTQAVYSAKDIMNSLATFGVGEVDVGYLRLLIENGTVSNTDNTLLEQLGEFYVIGRMDLAKNLASYIIPPLLPPQYSAQLLINDTVIFESRPFTNVSPVIMVSKKIISGIINRTIMWGPLTAEFRVWLETNVTNQTIPAFLECNYNHFCDPLEPCDICSDCPPCPPAPMYIWFVTPPTEREPAYVERNWVYMLMNVSNKTALDTVKVNWGKFPGPYVDVTVDSPSLLGLWHFNGDAKDNSRYGNDGILSPGVNCSSKVPGVFGSACYFDGTVSRINIFNGPSLNIRNAFTIEAWIKTTMTSEGWIVSKFGASNSGGYGFSTISGSQIRFTTRNETDWDNFLTTTANINDGSWHHVAVVYNKTNKLIYIDGNRNAIEVYSGTITSNPDGLFIGRNSAGMESFRGTIDEVRIWNYSKSAEEIKATYQAELSGYNNFVTNLTNYNPSNLKDLLGLWHMNGNAEDSSGRGKNSIIYGGPNCYALGNLSNGCNFNGSTDYIAVLDNFNPTAYTIEAWIKPADIKNESIFLKTAVNPTTTWSYQLRINGSRFQHSLLSPDQFTRKTITGDITTVVPGTWYHVAGVATTNGMMRLYVNGWEEGTAVSIGTLWAGGATYMMGVLSGEGMRLFNGTIDELRIWNYTKSAAEIRDTYQKELTLHSGFYANFTNNDLDSTYFYKAWANQSDGNSSTTDQRQITLMSPDLDIFFVEPTPANNSVRSIDSAYVNVSIASRYPVDTFKINWNGTNITTYGKQLLGLWHLNNDTNDSSQYANHGTAIRVNCSSQIPGYLGSACYFNGSGYINVDGSGSLNFDNSFTIEAWTWLSDEYLNQGDNTLSPIVSKFSGLHQTYLLSVYDGWYFFLIGSFGAYGISKEPAPTNTWVHVALVYNGTNGILYLNGEYNDSRTISLFMPAPTEPVRIGGIDEDYGWIGYLDEVRIWNYSKSAEEIKATYQLELGRYYANFSRLENTNYTFYAWANNSRGNQSRTETRKITVAVPFDFSISLRPDNDTVERGYNVSTYVTVSLLSGETRNVSFMVDSRTLPANINIQFSPINCSPDCQSFMSVETYPTTAIGMFNITVVGTNGSMNRSINYSLGIVPKPVVVPDFIEYMYAGSRPGGYIYAYNGTDWFVSWNTPSAEIWDFALHNGEIYAGGSPEGGNSLYKFNGTEWMTVPGAPAETINALAVSPYDNKLYIGTNITGVGRIHRYNGTDWEYSIYIDSPLTTAFYSLAVYNGSLYAGGGPNGYVYRFNGTGWTRLQQLVPGGTIRALETYGDNIYAAVSLSVGTAYLYQSAGTSWSQVTGSYRLVEQFYSLAPYTDYKSEYNLYIGTANMSFYTNIHKFNGTFKAQDSIIPAAISWDMTYYKDGKLYAATFAPANGVIFAFNGTKWNVSYNASPQAQAEMLSIFYGGQPPPEPITPTPFGMPPPYCNRVYIFGGQGTSSPLNEIIEYDPISNTVTSKTPFTAARQATSAAYYTQNNTIYVFGGHGTSNLWDIVAYEPIKNTVTTKTETLPTKRNLTSAVTYIPINQSLNTSIYIFGGRDASTIYDQIVEYFPHVSSVTPKSAPEILPRAIYATSAAYFPPNDKIYIFGGRDATTIYDDIVEYSPANKAVVTKNTKLPTARHSTSAAYFPGSNVVDLEGESTLLDASGSIYNWGVPMSWYGWYPWYGWWYYVRGNNRWNIVVNTGYPGKEALDLEMSGGSAKAITGGYYYVLDKSGAIYKYDASTKAWSTFANCPCSADPVKMKFRGSFFYVLDKSGTIYRYTPPLFYGGYLITPGGWTTLLESDQYPGTDPIDFELGSLFYGVLDKTGTIYTYTELTRSWSISIAGYPGKTPVELETRYRGWWGVWTVLDEEGSIYDSLSTGLWTNVTQGGYRGYRPVGFSSTSWLSNNVADAKGHIYKFQRGFSITGSDIGGICIMCNFYMWNWGKKGNWSWSSGWSTVVDKGYPGGWRIFIFGGQGVSKIYNDILEYDPETGIIINKTVTLPTARYSTSAVAVPIINKVYIFGGRDASNIYNDILEYDPLNDTIKTVNWFSSARYATSAVCARNNIITTLDNNAAYVSMAIGSDTLPIISYYDTANKDLKVTKCGNMDCSAGNKIRVIESFGDVGKYSSIANNIDGLPVISYQNYGQFVRELKLAKCRNLDCKSKITLTLDSGSDSGTYSSMDVANAGPVIVHKPSGLELIKCNNAGCYTRTTKTLDTSTSAGQYSSIVINSSDNAIVSYFDGTGIVVVTCNNAACSSFSKNTVYTGSSEYTSIAIGSDNLPVISFYDSANGDLKVVKCGNAACSSGNIPVTVDSAGDVGQYSSIAIGIDGFPIISYYDASNIALKVTKCNNLDCSQKSIMTLVPNSGGRYTSIKIGVDGLPIIGYISASSELKVLKCGSLSCS